MLLNISRDYIKTRFCKNACAKIMWSKNSKEIQHSKKYIAVSSLKHTHQFHFGIFLTRMYARTSVCVCVPLPTCIFSQGRSHLKKKTAVYLVVYKVFMATRIRNNIISCTKHYSHFTHRAIICRQAAEQQSIMRAYYSAKKKLCCTMMRARCALAICAEKRIICARG